MMMLKELKLMVDKAIELRGENAVAYMTVYETICISGEAGGPAKLDIDITNPEESSPELMGS